jgi:signal peptidase II
MQQIRAFFRRQPMARYVAIVVGIVVVDQAVKLAVKLNMEPGPASQVRLIGEVFRLYFTENPGAASGLTFKSIFPSLSDETAKLLLTFVSLALMGGIAWFLYRIRHVRTWLPVWMACILGGAIGNLIDRVFYGVWFAGINDYEGGYFHGRVVDMFYIDIYKGYLPPDVPFFGGDYVFLWPIFNVADAAIFVSVIVLMLFSKRLWPEEGQAQPEGANTAPDEPSGEEAGRPGSE